MNKVRVRFAPSPTGFLHIGGARTALFNWFFAKQTGGKLILRIEDTDTERLKKDSVNQILQSLEWLGIDWDEGPAREGDFGPYYQSQRQNFYNEAAEQLIQAGKAYYCFCTTEELELERAKQRELGLPFRYSGKCRELTQKQIKEILDSGNRPVVRIKLPETGKIVIDDLIRGSVEFQYNQFDDFIIIKSNGLPAYNFACVVDDHAMMISHVIRAEEHLSNTPKQSFLFESLGYEIPQFAHLSMILAPDRSKLSKRHGATSLDEFREMGCLPDAIVNYLTLLGWSPGGSNSELFSSEQTVRSFSLEKVAKTSAIYDINKLIWMNGQYMTFCDIDTLTRQALPFFVSKGLLSSDELQKKYDYLRIVVETVRERVKTLQELADASSYFFEPITSYSHQGIQKHFTIPGVAELLIRGVESLQKVNVFDVENTEIAYRLIISELDIKGSAIIHPTRLALTGKTVSPGLFDVMAVLGKERCLERLQKAIDFIRDNDLEKE